MKIVLLDLISLGNGIDLSGIKKYGELKTYDLTSKEEISERIKDAKVIITNKVYIGKKEMEASKNLSLICVAATGYNNIDIEEANKRGIMVANVSKYSTESVAQTVFTYLLLLSTNIDKYDKEVKDGEWMKSPIFTMLNYNINELYGKKIGIVGYGEIGKRVGEIAKAFGMKMLIAKRPGCNYRSDSRMEFEEVLRESDIITIHTPLSAYTKNLFTEIEFSLMKKNAILINTARGQIVNEEDLYNALKEEKIKAAALDVMEEEPPKTYKKLFELDNIIITPHIAWASIESRKRLIEGIEKNIEEFINKTLVSIMV